MSSAFQAWALAIQALLEQSPAVAARVSLGQRRPVPEGVASAASIRLLSAHLENEIQYTGHPLQWATLVAIELSARATSNSTADQAVDTVLQAAYARLLGDATLSAVMTPQSMTWDDDQANDAMAGATLLLRLRHQTQSNAI